MIRQPRHERRRGVRVRLTERDALLLHFLGRMRLCRTADLHALVFQGIRKDTAAERLRRLYDGGFVEVIVRDRAEENLYSLGPKGKEHLRARGDRVSPLPRPPLDHHLAITRVWRQLATASAWRLERALADWELRADFSREGLALVPDLFAVLQLTAGKLALAVEVDCGTESLRTLRWKFERYEALLSEGGLFGFEEFAIGLAVQDGYRKDAIADLLTTYWPGPSVVWDEAEGPESAILGQLEERA